MQQIYVCIEIFITNSFLKFIMVNSICYVFWLPVVVHNNYSVCLVVTWQHGGAFQRLALVSAGHPFAFAF